MSVINKRKSVLFINDRHNLPPFPLRPRANLPCLVKSGPTCNYKWIKMYAVAFNKLTIRIIDSSLRNTRLLSTKLPGGVTNPASCQASSHHSRIDSVPITAHHEVFDSLHAENVQLQWWKWFV